MNHDILQDIRERRSIRRYTSQEVEPEKLAEVLAAAGWSPSWGNSQCWEIVVVRDQGLKEQLAGILSPKNPATKAMVNAPVVLAICGKMQKAGWYNDRQVTRYQDWLLYDLGLMSQTLCLAAHRLGLGTVIVGSFEHGRAEELLQVPAGFELVALIPLGYPDHAPSPPARRAVADFVHYEHF